MFILCYQNVPFESNTAAINCTLQFPQKIYYNEPIKTVISFMLEKVPNLRKSATELIYIFNSYFPFLNEES